ncbi:MAG: DUF4435 domain-containing protein [Muribaculaceae bacterium]|nr:DUF4435 domain-containing protein [Muribaculaceae bacterium]
MNSILAHINNKKGDKFSEVRLAYNGSVRGARIMLIVEGKDDEKFYENFASDNLYVYSLEGCEWMEDVLHRMNLGKKRKIAGIKDADFDILNNTPPVEPSLFLTDWHDHEMMCAGEESCRIIAEANGIGSEEGIKLHSKILKNLREFSKIKWYCSIVRKQYKKLDNAPENISFKKCKAVHHYGLTLEENLNRVNLRQTHMRAPLNYTDIQRFLNRRAEPELRMLVNGHDYCSGICHELKRITNKNITVKEISEMLRNSLSLEDFSKTNLAQSISDYFYPLTVWRS